MTAVFSNLGAEKFWSGGAVALAGVPSRIDQGCGGDSRDVIVGGRCVAAIAEDPGEHAEMSDAYLTMMGLAVGDQGARPRSAAQVRTGGALGLGSQPSEHPHYLRNR